MRKIFIALLSLITLLSFPAAAAESQEMELADFNPQKSYHTLSDLDRAIDNASLYDGVRLHKIDSCKALLKKAGSLQDRYRLISTIRRLYDKFRTDSATVYAKASLCLAEKIGDPLCINESHLALGKEYETAGLHSEALAHLDAINRRTASKSCLIEAYDYYSFIYSTLAELSFDPEVTEFYRKKSSEVKDSLLIISPENARTSSDKLVEKGKYAEALAELLPFCDSLPVSDSRKGPVALSVADIYTSLGLRDKVEEYLVISSVSDILNAKKEYVSLRSLAMMLYEDGDITRAHRYLKKALDDASFCKARLKVDAVAPIISIVNESYLAIKHRNMIILVCCLVFTTVLFGVMALLVLLLRRRKNSLASLTKELQAAQVLQQQANESLREASDIKNVYITGLMLECIARIERLDQYRRRLNRLSMDGEKAALSKELKSNAVVDEEWNSFYGVFDRTFLSLFPTFLSDVNALLKPDFALSCPDRNALTPELRIYALIRLGITSTDRISTLLRYSRSTIYAYRSRTRLKALRPQTFEDEVAEISSI